MLVHASREQLHAWKLAIETFLRDVLRLDVKAGTRLQPLSTGVDFLGYVVYPDYKRVRGRVVRHARAALSGWAQRHVRRDEVRATPREYRHLQSVWASYEGHFGRANAWRLRRQFHQKFPWLKTLIRKRRFHREADDVVLGFRL